MYSMWKIMCFFNLKTHKHIALHQIHKIMLFLATSYNPFKDNLTVSNKLGANKQITSNSTNAIEQRYK